MDFDGKTVKFCGVALFNDSWDKGGGVTGGMAEWRETQGYFEKSNKVYLFWHFGGQNFFWGTFSGKKKIFGGIFGENFFFGKIGAKKGGVFFRSKKRLKDVWFVIIPFGRISPRDRRHRLFQGRHDPSEFFFHGDFSFLCRALKPWRAWVMKLLNQVEGAEHARAIHLR